MATVAALAGCAGGGGGSDGSGGESEGNDGDSTDTEAGGDAATTSEGGGDDLRLGVLLPFSGNYGWVGANVLPVVNMLVEEINAEGGIDGRELSVVQGDTEASPDASVSATSRLVNVEDVDVVIGPTSITMSAVIDTLVENEVPVVTPTAGTTSLDTRGGDFVFRTVSSDSLGGRAIARALSDQAYNSVQDYERVAMMVGDQEVFQSFKAPVRSSFEEFGGTVTTAMDIRTGKASYTSEVEQMMQSDPEICVLIASVEDSVKITEAGFQANYEGNWFATQDQTNQDFLSQSENAVTEGMLGLNAAAYQPAQESGRLDDFFGRITEYAGWDEGGRTFATNTYDAMNVVGLALKQIATDGSDFTGPNIASAVRTVATPPEQQVTAYPEGAGAIESGTDVNYEGLVGPVDFDENGDIVAPFSIKIARDGEWTEAARLPPEAL